MTDLTFIADERLAETRRITELKFRLYQELLHCQDDDERIKIEEEIRSIHEGRYTPRQDKRQDCYEIQRGMRG